MKKVIIAVAGLAGLLVAGIIIAVVVLSSMDFNQYKGLISEEAEKATGRKLEIAGDLDLKISLTPSLDVNGVTFANAKWGSRPEMVTLKTLSAEVSILPLLSGEVHVNRLVLEGLDVLVETDKAGKGNWEFSKSEKAEEKAAESGKGGVLPVVRMVALRDVKLVYKDGVTGEAMDARIAALDLSAESASSPLMLNLTGSYNGAGYKVAGSMGSISDLLNNAPFKLDVTAAALSANLGLKGVIKDLQAAKGIDLRVTAEVPSLVQTLTEAAAIVPALKDAGPVPAVDITFSGNVYDQKGGYGVKGMALKLGNSDLAGDASAILDGPRPSVVASLTSNLLDVDQLLPPEQEAAPSEPAKKDDGRVFPDDPLPLDGLKAADAEVNLAAGLIKAKGNEVKDLGLTLSLQNGLLKVSPFKATAVDGLIAGDILLDARQTPILTAKVSVKQLDYGKLLTQLQGEAPAEGKVDVNVDIKGSGQSVRALMAKLNGSLRVVTENGKINSGALNVASADILSVLPGMDSKDDKVLRCAVIDYRVTNGLAKSHATVIETGGFSVIGEGTINLADETLKLEVDPRAKKTNLASAAMVPMNVTGTLASPSVAPQATAIAKGALSIGAAVATGGLSLLAEKAVGVAKGAVVDETDYCAVALAGKAVTPSEPEEAPAKAEEGTSGGTTQPAEQKSGDGVLGGAGKALKGLFGN